MKWTLLLLFTLACASQKTPDSPTVGAPTTEEQAVTESNAKPISPYSVQACYCMKIFEPVCASDGMTYGNSCEAECQGNKTWKDGPCPEVPKKK